MISQNDSEKYYTSTFNNDGFRKRMVDKKIIQNIFFMTAFLLVYSNKLTQPYTIVQEHFLPLPPNKWTQSVSVLWLSLEICLKVIVVKNAKNWFEWSLFDDSEEIRFTPMTTAVTYRNKPRIRIRKWLLKVDLNIS